MLRSSTQPNTSRNNNPYISKSHLFPNVRLSKHGHEKQWSVIVWEKYFLPRRNVQETRGIFCLFGKNLICMQVILGAFIKSSYSEAEMLGNFISRLKRCSYRQLYNHSHAVHQFRVQNATGKFVFTALTAFRLLWRAKGKKRPVQVNVRRYIQASLMPENPTSGWRWPCKHFKSLNTAAKLSQVKSTARKKKPNSKFYSPIENLIQSPAKSYRVQPLSSSNTPEGFPTQKWCKGSRSKWRRFQTHAAQVTTPQQGLSGEATAVSHS